MMVDAEGTSLAESPEAWRTMAVGLKRSSDLIWTQWYGQWSRLKGGGRVTFSPQDSGDLVLLLPTYLLLLGLAFENLLKGILIAKDASSVQRKVQWRVSKGGHDLKELCAEAGILAGTDEHTVLEALTEAILWAGRYPVPKHHEGRTEHAIPLGWQPGALDVDNVVEKFGQHKATCDKLFSRIHDEYPRTYTTRLGA